LLLAVVMGVCMDRSHCSNRANGLRARNGDR